MNQNQVLLDKARRDRVWKAAILAEARSQDATRHKCFVSYHVEDAAEVEDFLATFGTAFIPRVIGVSEDDDFIDSTDTDYVMDQIREKYLTDSTVTIVLVGKCTKARKFVDWEVYSTLRNDKKNRRSGLLAINLPSMGTIGALPARVSDNVDGDKKYARYWVYPTSSSQLQGWIETAFNDRTGRKDLINNSRARMTYNASCG